MANPHEKKVFIGVKDFTLHIDNAGYKYIQWTGENEYNVLYDYELEEILDRIKQYKGNAFSLDSVMERFKKDPLRR